MTMTCDDVLEVASSGEKGFDGRPDLLEHLSGCARCRDEAPAILATARAIRGLSTSAFTGHPSSDRIVAIAMGPGAPGLEVERGVAEHVEGCATCTAEVREVRRAEQKRLSPSRSPRPDLGALVGSPGRALAHLTRRPFPAGVALVTSLGVLILAYPAFLGLRVLPRVEGKMGDLELRTRQLEAESRDLTASLAQANEALTRLGRWSGPLRLFTLTSPVRGQSEEQSISVDPAAPHVLVSLRPILTGPLSEPDVYRFLILDTTGREAWASELTAGEMRREMKASGALVFPIASTLLPPGRYELRVLPKGRPREPILQIPFEVTPPG